MTSVKLFQLDGEGEPELVTVIEVRDGQAVCDNPAFMEKWTAKGILGRPENGRVFPADGLAFLAELPYMYRSAYFWAEKRE